MAEIKQVDVHLDLAYVALTFLIVRNLCIFGNESTSRIVEHYAKGSDHNHTHYWH